MGHKPNLMTAEGIEEFMVHRKTTLAGVMKQVSLRRSHVEPSELQRIARLALKLPRPWIDGGVTAKEWCDAVDELKELTKRG